MDAIHIIQLVVATLIGIRYGRWAQRREDKAGHIWNCPEKGCHVKFSGNSGSVIRYLSKRHMQEKHGKEL